jgi:hypothetical protein
LEEKDGRIVRASIGLEEREEGERRERPLFLLELGLGEGMIFLLDPSYGAITSILKKEILFLII